MFYVPVVTFEQQPLMPTTLLRARRWIMQKKATPFWKGHVFCVRLNVKAEENKQDIAVGVDPGSKKEAFTVKSRAHTYLNVQTDAVTHVSDAIKTRREMRRTRRNRNTPCRKPKQVQGRSLPPSTRARWLWKLNILNWLYKLFPVTCTIVEDIKARTKGQKRWDKSFSPLEQGKKWFYEQVLNLVTKEGWETKELRDKLNLKKSTNKLSNNWSAHCVDSFVLANSITGGNIVDNKQILLVVPIRLHRRQLHRLQPENGVRKSYGSTNSLGLKRGSLIKHPKYNTSYVGGTSKGKISLHSVQTSVRLTQNVDVQDCKFLCHNRRRAFLLYPKW